MPRYRSRQIETESVNPRLLRRGAVKRQHLTRWAVGADELAPGIIGDTHINPTAIQQIIQGAQAGKLLVMSASAASVDDGGDYLTFDTVVAVKGFSPEPTAGDSWVHPVEGVYVLDYEHVWDTFDEGGTIEVEVDGELLAEGTIASGTVGLEGRGTIVYYAPGSSTGKIKVTQGSGSAQDCDAVMRLAITDPITEDVPAWEKVFTGDVYDLVFDGTNWWTTNGGNATVTKRDTAFASVTTFSADANQARGITFDGTDLWVTGDGNPGSERISEHSVAGALLSSFNTGPNTDGNTGLAWDGSQLWLVWSTTGVADAERWTTAGVMSSSFSLPGTPGDCQGAAYFGGALYVVDMTASLLRIFQPDGVALGTIDLSGAVTAPTGAWIASDGTLYVSKDGDGIYRRSARLAPI